MFGIQVKIDKQVLVAALPIMMGYFPLGLACGVLAGSVGLSTMDIALMSIFVFAGSGQFIALAMMGSGAAAISSIVLTTFIVNLRHLLYSSTLVKYISSGSHGYHMAFAQEIVDEICKDAYDSDRRYRNIQADIATDHGFAEHNGDEENLEDKMERIPDNSFNPEEEYLKAEAEDEVKAFMEKAKLSFADGRSIAFVVRKGALTYDNKVKYSNDNANTRESIIEEIVKVAGNDIIVSTTGKASRELFEIRERRGEGHEHDFLTVGSMGHASSIALGIALAKPDSIVWVIDGDGAALMHMGAMPVIAKANPEIMPGTICGITTFHKACVTSVSPIQNPFVSVTRCKVSLSLRFFSSFGLPIQNSPGGTSRSQSSVVRQMSFDTFGPVAEKRTG